MTFGAPWVLALLALLPVLLLIYVLRFRPRSSAEAFALPHMEPSVQPARPRWRRHLPVIAALLALAILILASAQPQRSVAVEVERASIMMATDVSGSMSTRDVLPNRLAAAKRAERTFLRNVPDRVRVGVMAYNQTPAVLQAPTTDRAAARAAVNSMKISGATATGDAINAAVRTLRSGSARIERPPAAIVLLSDGESTRGSDPVQAAQAAKRQEVRIYTVSLGTGAGTDPATLRRVAQVSGGEFFSASDARGLRQVYRKLGSQLGTVEERQQVTSLFAGTALLVLLGACAMSLRWFGRLL